MDYRIATILAKTDLGAAGTKTIDITLSDIISRIQISFKAKNGADGLSAHPAANVTKIELVDGSDVLFSLSGHEAQGVNFYNRGAMPYTWIDSINTHWVTASLGIDFGRFLCDPELALDPTRFTNPQLKITWDEDVAQTSAADNYCTVLAYVFDELKPSPVGFLMTKQHYSYSGKAGAYEYIDLPLDHPMRQIFVVNRLAGESWTTNIENVKLSENNDKRIPLELDNVYLLRLALERYGYHTETAYLKGVTSATHFYPAHTDAGFIVGAGYGADASNVIYTLDGGDAAYNTGNAAINMKAVIKGLLPHGVMPLLISDKLPMEKWYDVTKLGSLKLRIKAGSSMGAGATMQVITQQLRR